MERLEYESLSKVVYKATVLLCCFEHVMWMKSKLYQVFHVKKRREGKILLLNILGKTLLNCVFECSYELK